MRHEVVSDTALTSLALRTWRARGGYLFPLRVISVAHVVVVTLRLLDIRESLHCVGSWTISEYGDVPDAIRLIAARDRDYAGLVFHDRVGADGCYWELVDPSTLAPARMFSRDWRASYGAV